MKKVLFFKLGALGDLSYAMPAPEAITHEWPDAQVTWVVGKSGAEFLRGHPFINQIIEVDEKRFFADDLRICAREIALLAWKLRGRFDVAFVAHRAKAYSYLLKPFVRGDLFQLVRSEKDTVWGVPVVVPPMSLQESLAIRRLVETGIGRAVPWRWDYSYIEGLAGFFEQTLPSTYTVLHIGGGRNFKTEFELKKWPHWDELVLKMKGDLVLVGAPSERDEAEELAGEFSDKKIFNLVGKTSLRQLVAVLRGALLFVGIDSGPLHIADSLGISCVGIYGPTSLVSWGLLGEKSRAVSAGPECAPCYLDDGDFPECAFEHRCMRDLSAERVFSATREVEGHTASPELRT